MKPTSIIFLIFSVVIMIAGSLLCTVAEKKAQEQNIELFIQQTDNNGNSVIRYDIDETKAETIVLNTAGTKINVIPCSDVTHIELVNYKINTFTFHQSDDTVTFNDNTNLLTLLNLQGEGAQFLGIRHYKNKANFKSGTRTLNLYLADDFKLNELQIVTLSSDVQISDCASVLSYKLQTGTGAFTVDNVRDAEKLDVNVTEKGSVALKRSVIVDVNATMNEGTFSFTAAQSNVQSYALNVTEGSIYVDGEEFKETYNAASAAALVTCRVNLQNGNIIVNDLS